MTEPRADEDVEDWASLSLREIEQADRESEINEMVWQALIGAYCDHDGWRTVAEAVFRKHNYTPEEIIRENT